MNNTASKLNEFQCKTVANGFVNTGEDHSALSVDVNAVGELNRTLGTHHYVPTTRPYRKGSYYDFSYSVYFPAEDFKNLPGVYCYTFMISLKFILISC